jgi:hypothetical protein
MFLNPFAVTRKDVATAFRVADEMLTFTCHIYALSSDRIMQHYFSIYLSKCLLSFIYIIYSILKRNE